MRIIVQISRAFSASLSNKCTKKPYERYISKKNCADYECERQSETCSQFMCLCKLSEKYDSNAQRTKHENYSNQLHNYVSHRNT